MYFNPKVNIPETYTINNSKLNCNALFLEDIIC